MLNSILYKAIFKSVVGRFSIYFIQILSLIVTARLFGPKEFGVIASIQVFVIFFQMLADVGIGPAIINEDEFGEKKRDGIFSITLILGVFLSILFYVFSYFLNYFYNEYEYQNIAIMVGIGIFFSSLSILPVTALNKDTKFLHVAAIDISAELLALLGVVFLFYQGYGVIALASRTAIQSSIKFILSWFVSKYTHLGRPKFGKEMWHIKSIFSFSMYQFGFNFINYFSKNLDNILVGKYLGLSNLGVYDRAYQLMRYPLMLTSFAITPAIQPVLTKVKQEKRRVAYEHASLCSKLLLISLPIASYIYVNSYSIVIFIFGKDWVEVEPLLRIFALIIPIQTVVSVSGAFYQVMNKTKLLFIAGVISSFNNISAIFIGIKFGSLESVATAVCISYFINFFINKAILIIYCFGDEVKNFLKEIFKSLIVLPSILIYIYISFKFDVINDSNVVFSLVINGLVLLSLLLLVFKPIKHLILKS